MYLSKKNNYKNNGFTLMELIVVVAGLAILSSLSIPNILGRIKLNRVEEVKALMNSFALDCLGKYRISTNPASFIENAAPDELDNVKLSTLQYKIDGDKNKCSHVAIKPLNDNEKDLFAFDFRMLDDGRILKTAKPSDNPRFLNSCRNWAGKNCGLSDEQVAEFARIKALTKAKALCDSAYDKWIDEKGTGKNVAWDSQKENCTREVFAYKGRAVNSYDAVLAAEESEMDSECINWRKNNMRNSKYISPNGKPETMDACKGVDFWFHSGSEFRSQIEWNEKDDKAKVQLCNQNREDARLGGTEGEYTYTPDGPPPCGTVTYLCNKKEYQTLDMYKATSCGATPIEPPPDPIPDHCKDFTPDITCQYLPEQDRLDHPLCNCK